MQTGMVAHTSMSAPYDGLRALVCRNTQDGRVCGGMLGEINWTQAGTHSRKCQRCKAINVTHIHVVGAVTVDGV